MYDDHDNLPCYHIIVLITIIIVLTTQQSHVYLVRFTLIDLNDDFKSIRKVNIFIIIQIIPYVIGFGVCTSLRPSVRPSVCPSFVNGYNFGQRIYFLF